MKIAIDKANRKDAAFPMIRVNPATKAEYQRLASEHGITLSCLARLILERALEQGIQIE